MNKTERFSASDPLSSLFRGRTSVTLGGVPDGLEGRILGRLAEAEGTILFVARDARRLAQAETALAFFAPTVPTLTFPAWDSLPYDRVSPNAEISARRMSALHDLLQPHTGPRVVFTTANAIVQRVPDRQSVAARVFAASARQGRRHGPADRLARHQRLRPHRDGARIRRVCRSRRHRRPLGAGHARADPPRFLRRYAGDDPPLRPGEPAHHPPGAAR